MEKVDEEKIETAVKVIASMGVPNMVTVLLISDDDFVWMEYYTSMFLERKTILICHFEYKQALDKHMTEEHKKYIHKIIYTDDLDPDNYSNELTNSLNELAERLNDGSKM